MTLATFFLALFILGVVVYVIQAYPVAEDDGL